MLIVKFESFGNGLIEYFMRGIDRNASFFSHWIRWQGTIVKKLDANLKTTQTFSKPNAAKYKRLEKVCNGFRAKTYSRSIYRSISSHSEWSMPPGHEAPLASIKP